MSVDLLPAEEVKKIAWNFLKSFGPRYTTEEYFGDILSEAYFALHKFDPSMGFQPSTLIYRFCRNRLISIIKKEKEYYQFHTFHSNIESFASKSKTPYFYTAKYEMMEIISASNLSARTKEVVLTRIDFPDETLKEVGSRLGVSKQCVEQHMRSAEQYFTRNKIEFSL